MAQADKQGYVTFQTRCDDWSSLSLSKPDWKQLSTRHQHLPNFNDLIQIFNFPTMMTIAFKEDLKVVDNFETGLYLVRSSLLEKRSTRGWSHLIFILSMVIILNFQHPNASLPPLIVIPLLTSSFWPHTWPHGCIPDFNTWLAYLPPIPICWLSDWLAQTGWLDSKWCEKNTC